MMNYIWVFIILFSVVCSFFTGNVSEFTNAFFEGSAAAVSLCMKLTGSLCLWGGIMEIAEKGGISNIVASCLRPLLNRLFPAHRNDSDVMQAVSMNITANLLGLGNAATPLGIEAVRRMQQKSLDKTAATTEMMVFIVMNTAALRLIPTTVAALRQASGAAEPMDIILCVWISSLLSQTAAVGAVKLISRFRK